MRVWPLATPTSGLTWPRSRRAATWPVGCSQDAHTEDLCSWRPRLSAARGEAAQRRAVRAGAPAGLDQEIAETVGHVAVNVLTNLFNKLAVLRKNHWPVVTPYPHAAEH